MASTFGSLEIAKSGMMTYNAAIQTTAHNIANIETEGYSRQTTNRVSLVGNKTSITVQGFGVDVASITRERNEYYDSKYQRTQSVYNQYKTEAYYLTSVQDLLCGGITNDENALITSAFDEFCATLSNLVGNPENSTIRTEVTTKAETFTEFVTTLATNLQTLQDEANTEIKTCVEQINAYAEKIVSLNKQISTVESYGTIANDLRDQRSLLIDELAQYCNVETKEVPPADGVGETQYYVYVNGGLLVDTFLMNELVVTQKESYTNINDISGIYDISWADGSGFNEYSKALGGKLQSLFEIRDGNNGTAPQGTVSDLTNNAAGNLILTITDCNVNDVNALNIPAYDGEITINNHLYEYESFEVIVGEDGEFTFEFALKDDTPAEDATVLQNAITYGYEATVGTNVNYKGIPHYMAQLNEFVRTYAQEFNRIQNEGYDLDDKSGMDFFNATVPADGENYIFTESVDGKDASFTSLAKKNDDGTYTGSYYYMTALNFSVTKEVANNPDKIAGKMKETPDSNVGNDNGDNIQRLTDLKDDSRMFVHGAPDSFIQSLISTLGVNSSRANSMEEAQSNLLYAIDTNRKSVSGVDEDEEGSDLIIWQNMLQNQYKVLSVMNQVLDKLINETGL